MLDDTMTWAPMICQRPHRALRRAPEYAPENQPEQIERSARQRIFREIVS
jgi:hypothetical protein